jgi:hypothetical protein
LGAEGGRSGGHIARPCADEVGTSAGPRFLGRKTSSRRLARFGFFRNGGESGYVRLSAQKKKKKTKKKKKEEEEDRTGFEPLICPPSIPSLPLQTLLFYFDLICFGFCL